jgi:acetyl-CoA carboxylase carboxyltransferase component
VTGISPAEIGVTVSAGQIVATIAPTSRNGDHAAPRQYGEDTWAPTLADVRALQAIAHKRFAPDSQDPGVLRQRRRSKLTCRERIDLLLDSGSFREVGSLAGFADYDENGRVAGFTPANHVGGWGKIEGRTAVVCADDFTSRGGHADGAIMGKSAHLDRLSIDLRCPSIRLLDGSSGGGSVAAMVPKQQKANESHAQESSGTITAGRPRVSGEGGSFLPGHLGSSMYVAQLSQVPVVNVLLGSVVGIGAAKAVLGHFAVMVRDIAQLFVAGPPVVTHAMGYEITKEELGGWHIHCRNGSVDNLAESEEEAAAMTKRFLSYLPSSVYEAPPVVAPDSRDPVDRKGGEWMIAFAQVAVPIFTVIMRRSFGVAGNNYATPRSGASARVVWPAADVGGIPPEGGIEAAYKRQLAEAADPAALRAEINARIESARGPIGPLSKFQMEEMIDPRETRRWVCEWVENAYRIVSQPAALGPRALQFRP